MVNPLVDALRKMRDAADDAEKHLSLELASPTKLTQDSVRLLTVKMNRVVSCMEVLNDLAIQINQP